jgi:hypothetical protein
VIEYQKVVMYLKKNGYNEQENIADYWFSNHEKLVRIVNQRFPHHSQIFDLQVRWRSAMGEACVKALKSYIEQLQEQARLESSRRYQLGDLSCMFVLAKLDLNSFTFHFNEQEYSIKAVADTFPTSQIGGWHDLRGIPLDGIRLADSALIGLNFSSASFVGASFQQVRIVHCNFVSANFDNARFVAVRHEQETALDGISVRGAFINAIELNDQLVSTPMRIREIGYFGVVKYLVETLVLKKSSVKHLEKWTRFQLVDVRGINDPLLRYQAEYVNWSQSLLGKIDGFYDLPVIERVSLLTSIALTKYWRSATALACCAFIINIVFTALYMIFSHHFKDFSGAFLESFYFSIVMFTGYGNITPGDDLGRTIVIFEAIIGYLTLGSFLFILGQKVSQRY